MKKIIILSIIVLSLCVVSCAGMHSTTLGSDSNTSDIYVFIDSELKTLYVSVPKDTKSISVCINKDKESCSKEDNKKTLDKDLKEKNDRKIIGISSKEVLKSFSIERMDSNQKTLATRNVELEKKGNNNSDDKYAPNPEGVELTKDELDMIVEVNKYREKNGRSILTVSKRLMQDSKQQSLAMQKYNIQKHTLYPKQVYDAENIYKSAKTVHDAMYGGGTFSIGFTQSSGHNENILSTSVKYIGVANIPEATEGFWTQRFSYHI